MEAEDPAAVVRVGVAPVAAVRVAAAPQVEASPVAGLAASEAAVDEAVQWSWAAGAADMTSTVRTVRSTTQSATLPSMPRLTLLPIV